MLNTKCTKNCREKFTEKKEIKTAYEKKEKLLNFTPNLRSKNYDMDDLLFKSLQWAKVVGIHKNFRWHYK